MRSLKVVSVVILLVVALSLLLWEQQMEKHEIREEIAHAQDDALHAAHSLRNKLSAQLTQAVNVLYGMRAFIEINPDITQQEFENYAASVKRSNRSIHHIAAAPDLVVRYVYPLKGNEAALGLDYRSAPMEQRAAAFRTMREGRSIIAGPVKLIQGGYAFIVRVPVYLPNEKGGTKTWGLLAAPINVETFYQNVGLADFSKEFDLAIRGHDSLGSEGDVFFGREDLFSVTADSILLDVVLENGSWVMAVKPKSGWPVVSSNHVFFRAAFLAAFTVFSITWLAAIGYFSERLQARSRQLKAFREKSEFLEILSHEIRSPLQGVLGAQKFLLDNGLADPMRSVVKEAHQSGEYIHSLINDYLDLQRAECKNLSIYPTPTDLRDTIENSFKIATTGEKRSSLSVNFYIAETVPLWLMLDQAKVRQVLVNIIGNALKYTNRGFVSIGASYAENNEKPVLTLTVEDTGIGIEKRELNNLFDRFTRSEQGERRSGSGLGLAIAKSLVEAMDGSIEVESILGKGTTFTVKLPTHKTPALDIQSVETETILSEEQIKSEKRKALLKKARVLVADDVVVNRILISAMLSPLVEKVTMVEDGVQVLEELHNTPYDIVIMDVHMPNMSGIEATKRIRGNPDFSDIAIVGLTGDEVVEIEKKLFVVGMDAVLMKPINLEPLLQKIEAVYGRGGEIQNKLAER